LFAPTLLENATTAGSSRQEKPVGRMYSEVGGTVTNIIPVLRILLILLKNIST
jgi:hypothetical protein